MKTAILLSLLSAAMLAGCGGGGGGGGDSASATTQPVPQPKAAGLYQGTDSNNRTVIGLVLDDDNYWVVYSPVGNPAFVAGVLQGSGISNNGSYASTDGRDFNLESRVINQANTTASYRAKQSFNGSISYPQLNQTVTFTTTYDADYEKIPSLSTLAATYTGTSAGKAGNETATITINTLGGITGIGNSGCRLTGSVTPRASGNAYNISVIFGGGNCALGTSTISGIAYYSEVNRRLYTAALNSARTDGFIFVGTRPAVSTATSAPTGNSTSTSNSALGSSSSVSSSVAPSTSTSTSSGSRTSSSGRCVYPDDRAADGSRCGNRASSVRPGGA